MTITVHDLQEALDYANKTNAVGFRAGDDLKKARLGWEFMHLKKALNNQELDYFCTNYEQLKDLQHIGNLSTNKLGKYIKFFYKNKTDLTQVIFNKRVNVTEDVCKQKIIDTLKYDFDSSRIKIGNIDLTVGKQEAGVYGVYQYVGKKFAKQTDGKFDIEGYNLLFVLNVPGLNLLPVDW